VKVAAVIPFNGDWTWYPGPCSYPYAVYCPLKVEHRRIRPYAVQLVVDKDVHSNIYGSSILPVLGYDQLQKTSSSMSPVHMNELHHKHTSATHQRKVVIPNKEIAVCVNPESGADAMTNDYDDPSLFISFINYYSSVAGITHFYVYNTLEKRGSNTWMNQVQMAAQKSRISIEMIPNVERAEKQFHHLKKNVVSNSTSPHSAYFFPTLFADLCLRYSMYRHEYVLLVR
jgi:hypothetical protein